MILDSALDAIGHTPLIRLDRISAKYGLKCNLLAKVEYLSAGGSVKDRIAKRMVEEAEKDGVLIPGKSVVIEPTSGNTGIGLALTCAVKGYPVIITLPEKMSIEKEATLKALGATVVRTPTEAPSESPESNIGVAKRLQKSIPYGVILDQYCNPNNPLAHYHTTAPEIISDILSTPSSSSHPSSMKVDCFIGGAGTGGTISGVSQCLKETHNQSCTVVAVDPCGSVLAEPASINEEHKGEMYLVEGIGYDFIPMVLSRKPGTVDHWIKISDSDSFAATQQLIEIEGLLVGGSSGSALGGALRWLTSDQGFAEIGSVEGKNAVVLLPDGIRNYMSKEWFLDIVKNKEPKFSKEISKILGRDVNGVEGAMRNLTVNDDIKLNGINH